MAREDHYEVTMAVLPGKNLNIEVYIHHSSQRTGASQARRSAN
jgi:hypothetical protein